MRPPSIQTLLRSLSLANLTTRLGNPSSRLTQLQSLPLRNSTIYRSMPTIPFLGSLFSSSARDMTEYPVKKNEEEWQAVLSPEQFRVIRKKGTEAPYTGEYDKHMPSAGVYVRFFLSFLFFSSWRSLPLSCLVRGERKGIRTENGVGLLTAEIFFVVADVRGVQSPPLQSDPQVQVGMRVARLL